MPTPKSKQTQTIPASGEQRPASTLNPFQLFLADLCAELVAHGGNEDDELAFLNDLISVYMRRCGIGRSEYFTEDKLQDFRERTLSEWSAKFRDSKRDMSKIKAKTEVAKSFADEVRANLREALVWELDNFAKECTPEEAWMIYDTMVAWRSERLHHEGTPGSVEIADAFYITARRSDRVFHVPGWMQKQINEHIKFLQEQRAAMKPDLSLEAAA